MRAMDENYNLPTTVAGRIAAKVREWNREAEYDAAVERMFEQAQRIVKRHG